MIQACVADSHSTGVVAWVSHLGLRMPALSSFLPAKGWPSNEPAEGVVDFLVSNLPLALLFVLPHSLVLPARLRTWTLPHSKCPMKLLRVGASARILYSVMAAASLHVFLAFYRPLPSTRWCLSLPLTTEVHNMLSITCLGFAMATYLAHPGTWSLLGVPQAPLAPPNTNVVLHVNTMNERELVEPC